MTIPQKAVFSFLLASFLMIGIVALAFTGVFRLVESRFINPARSEELVHQTAGDAILLNGFLSSLENRFSSLLAVPAVRRSFLPGGDTADIHERSRLLNSLLESVPGLQSVRFNEVYTTAREQAGFAVDKASDSLIFSIPFFDEFDVYRGTALFSVSAGVLTETLMAAGRMGGGENLILVNNPAGFILGFPGISGGELPALVSAVWADGSRSIVPVVSSGIGLTLVSVRLDPGCYFGRIVNESVLSFPQSVRVLVYIIIYVTIFLIIFFLFNFSLIPRTEIKNRAADFEYTEIEELEIVRDPQINPCKSEDEDPFADTPVEVVSPFSFMFSPLNVKGLFADLPDNPELLPAAMPAVKPAAESRIQPGEVIFEQDGIPYINRHVIARDDKPEEKINNDFIKLVKSVMSRV